LSLSSYPLLSCKGIRGHSVALQALGTFILWFGWYGFNPGSTLKLTGGADGVSALGTKKESHHFSSFSFLPVPSSAAINTTLASALGAIVSLLINFSLKKNWDIGCAINGLLAGLVAVTAPCAVVEPWSAAIIGFVAGGVYYGASRV
jgi:ammonium transporter, Amt family